MPKHRIFEALPLACGQHFSLNETNVRHLVQVLRLKPEQHIILFNGSGYDYLAKIIETRKKSVHVEILSREEKTFESPLHIHLGQVVSRGERMDITLQKAVELGVSEITPLLSTRCGVHLCESRWQKKQQHWQKVIISACEQCGRSRLPILHTTIPLETWVNQRAQEPFNIILDPYSPQLFRDLTPPSNSVSLLVGPEGGFSVEEVALTQHANFTGIRLGPRVLRTETAAMAALCALQSHWGDL